MLRISVGINRQHAKTDGSKEIKILRKNPKEMLEIRNEKMPSMFYSLD